MVFPKSIRLPTVAAPKPTSIRGMKVKNVSKGPLTINLESGRALYLMPNDESFIREHLVSNEVTALIRNHHLKKVEK